MPSAKRSSTSVKRPAAAARRPSRFRFITDTFAEMKKVTWLTRREAAYLTGLVLLVAISMGIILGLIDLGFSGLVNKLLLGG
ncbi:MAG: preprotein translocase subunit SecE [Dehalococcoidales bacterium]|nr:MAG: preprotein translocase subunit SecE [Dehalococcoidales bacterium]